MYNKFVIYSMQSRKNRVKNMKHDFNFNGFSLLELVVAVGVIFTLSAGGFLSYNHIRVSAVKAHHQNFAEEMYLFTVNLRNSELNKIPEEIHRWAVEHELTVALANENNCVNEFFMVDTDADYIVDGNSVQIDPSSINNSTSLTIYIVYVEKSSGKVQVVIQELRNSKNGLSIDIDALKTEPGFNESFGMCEK